MRSSFAFHKSNRNEEVFQYVGHAGNAGSNQQYAAGGTCKDWKAKVASSSMGSIPIENATPSSGSAVRGTVFWDVLLHSG